MVLHLLHLVVPLSFSCTPFFPSLAHGAIIIDCNSAIFSLDLEILNLAGRVGVHACD